MNFKLEFICRTVYIAVQNACMVHIANSFLEKKASEYRFTVAKTLKLIVFDTDDLESFDGVLQGDNLD